MNHLFYGDNLDVLRESIKDESVDLVYLDPPFNSDANYSQIFKAADGSMSHAQIEAFEDTWHWGEQAEREFQDLKGSPNTDVAEVMVALVGFLGKNDMMAYLVMMASRLLELHRVLKPTGSLYLHCDPTASHYLKIVLDAVFGPQRFLNEVIWKRTSAHSSAKRFGPVHDTLLFYSKGKEYTWNPQFMPYDQEYLDTFFDQVDAQGRRWKRMDLTGAGTRNGETGQTWRGLDVTAKGRHWAYPPKVLDKLDADGRIHWPKKAGGMPRLKQYPSDLPGVPAQDVIIDIKPMHNLSEERLGYPTQKPRALLDRLVKASSNPGDVVLDPFCGCGTAVHSAQVLGRKWVGIDITHLAISLIEKRLRDAFPGIKFDVHGTPKDVDGARDLATRDKYQFQWWACPLVDAMPYQGKKKGADGGIDGLIIFGDIVNGEEVNQKIVVSVKGGDNVNVSMIRDLGHVIEREKAAIGIFVTLAEPSKPMLREAAAMGFYKGGNGKQYPKLQVLTVEDLLERRARPEYPDTLHNPTYKKAKRERPKPSGSDVPLFEE